MAARKGMNEKKVASIVARVKKGEKVSKLAKQYKVSGSLLYYYLRKAKLPRSKRRPGKGKKAA